MKKISKKLSLASQTVRVLSGNELEGIAGGGYHNTIAVRPSFAANGAVCRHSVNAAGAVCRVSGYLTAMCVKPPGA